MLKEITQENMDAYRQLSQCYEEEFSSLTHIQKDEKGRYPLSTEIDDRHRGFLYYHQDNAVGFMIVRIGEEPFDVAEMYMTPAVRKLGLAKKMAFEVFDTFKVKWTVRELEEAYSAQKFWRRIIGEYTQGNFTEKVTPDPEWGSVVMQEFTSA